MIDTYLSPKETIRMKCRVLFSTKQKKNKKKTKKKKKKKKRHKTLFSS